MHFICSLGVELLVLLDEDGQIIELDLLIADGPKFRLIIRDGALVDIVGDGKKITDQILGGYFELDMALYNHEV